MELTPTASAGRTRRLRVRRRVAGALAAAVVAAVLLLLAPTGLGLRHVVVTDDAMGATLAPGSWRGSLGVVETVPGTELDRGDVVTFTPPGPWRREGVVTRRVVAVDDGLALTRGDAAERTDPWRLDLAQQSFARLDLRVPLLGGVAALLGPWWLGAAALALLAVAVVLARPHLRRPRGLAAW